MRSTETGHAEITGPVSDRALIARECREGATVLGQDVTGSRLQISRRGFFGLGAAATAGVFLRHLTWPEGVPTAFAAGPPLVQPEVLQSRNGVLEVTLEARVRSITVAGQANRKAIVYNGKFPGPTLLVDRGDRIKMKLVNRLDEVTNMHTHGFHVSPEGRSDNVLLHIDADETFDFQFDIPRNHPPGFYWYHPHAHAHGSQQMFGGMAGAVVFRSPPEQREVIDGLRDRVLVLQTTAFNASGDLLAFNGVPLSQQLHLVNGQLNPTIDIREGETQRWRILNASVNRFFNLSLAGHKLVQIAADGNPFRRESEKSTLLLGPGQRAEVMVQGGAAGSYELRALQFQPGGGTAQPNVVVATLVSQTTQEKERKILLQPLLQPFVDLRRLRVDKTRKLVFTADVSTATFEIDGKEFDANRVDQEVELNALEEWTVENQSTLVHPFHIHVNPFQVTHVNGRGVEAESYVDTVPIEPNGSITFRTRFLDFPGKSVYHCHLVPHSDRGMMGLFNVLPLRRRSGQPADFAGPDGEAVDGSGSQTFFNLARPAPAVDYICDIPGSEALSGWPPTGPVTPISTSATP